VFLFERSGDDDEIVLSWLVLTSSRMVNAHLLLEGISELNDGLFFCQPLWQSCLASLAPRRARGLDLLEAGHGRAAGRFGDALAPAYAALFAVHLDLAIALALPTPATAVLKPDVVVLVIFVETTRGRSAALANRERDGDIDRGPVLVALELGVSRERAAVEGVQRRLAANVAGPLGTHRLASLVDVDGDAKVLLGDGPAAVGSKRLVGDFRGRGLVEQVVRPGGKGRAFEAVVVEDIPFQDGRAWAAAAVLVDVEVAVAAGIALVLVEAQVLVVVAATATRTAFRPAASAYALKLLAIPSLCACTDGLLEVVQVAGGRAVGRHGGARGGQRMREDVGRKCGRRGARDGREPGFMRQAVVGVDGRVWPSWQLCSAQAGVSAVSSSGLPMSPTLRFLDASPRHDSPAALATTL